jgi:hypothetical protein
MRSRDTTTDFILNFSLIQGFPLGFAQGIKSIWFRFQISWPGWSLAQRQLHSSPQHEGHGGMMRA